MNLATKRFDTVIANPWGRFKKDAIRALNGALSRTDWESPVPIKDTLEEPPDVKLGDLATRICFELAKVLHKSPTWLASELGKVIKPSGLIAKVEISGNYLNFFADFAKITELTLKAVEKNDQRYGCSKIGKRKKIVVEHTSVNPTKPLHIGHGRNAVIGDTIVRLLRALDYEVEVQNYIDDMGRQVAESILAYRIIKRKPKAKFDHLLGLIYSQIHSRVEGNKKLEDEVRKILAQLERGKGETPRKARILSEKCVTANLETTDRINISYDLLVWESDLVGSGILNETIEQLKATNYLTEGTDNLAGTLVLKLSEFGLEDKVLIRSDGTAVYTMKDIVYQLWKFGKTKTGLRFKVHSKRPDRTNTSTTTKLGKPNSKFGKADEVINVVGAEQRFPQKVVFTSLNALGLEREFNNSRHLAYEHVWLPQGRFSGRKGTWVGFSVDDIIEEAVARSRIVVEEHAPETSEKFKQEAAEFVGVGAIRFSLISTSPEKRITFRWEDALNFDRNSGPAVQYSHARACSILRKAKEHGGKHSNDVFKMPQEQQLIRLLAKFPEIVNDAGERLQPHLHALYAAELSLAFNKFYEAAPVIEAGTRELREARLRLVNCVRIVLKNALNLIGITAPTRM